MLRHMMPPPPTHADFSPDAPPIMRAPPLTATPLRLRADSFMMSRAHALLCRMPTRLAAAAMPGAAATLDGFCFAALCRLIQRRAPLA